MRGIKQKIEIGTGLNDVLFDSIELKFKNFKEDARDTQLQRVCVRMHSCFEYGTLPHAAETPINFIQYMNSKTKAASKELNLPFKNNTNQRDLLIMMLSIFNNMRVLITKIVDRNITYKDVSQHMKFINGWKITINSLL